VEVGWQRCVCACSLCVLRTLTACGPPSSVPVSLQHCGGAFLYDELGIVLRASGAGLAAATAGRPAPRITIENCRAGKTCVASDVSLIARFYGPAIFSAEVVPSATNCSWSVEYTPPVPGQYTLELTLQQFRPFVEMDPHPFCYTYVATATTALPCAR
jgi:hypothetical protein